MYSIHVLPKILERVDTVLRISVYVFLVVFHQGAQVAMISGRLFSVLTVSSDTTKTTMSLV